jgi:hypothetical protein
MKNFRAREYSKTGFMFRGKMYYGIIAYFLYTCGFIKYRWKKLK